MWGGVGSLHRMKEWKSKKQTRVEISERREKIYLHRIGKELHHQLVECFGFALMDVVWLSALNLMWRYVSVCQQNKGLWSRVVRETGLESREVTAADRACVAKEVADDGFDGVMEIKRSPLKSSDDCLRGETGKPIEFLPSELGRFTSSG
ncbi:hypothetical protein BDN72DRAFT_864212 [Pluteus cervinus]|uniref:Uncharacterized protein n=1 Tax=Pluteus cervinus TaxID=181527 RepID=A0ACD3A5F3_9AGAR|nr:hypothetical protein BDN72DRAFT_864212 [Pluteus cervinus]